MPGMTGRAFGPGGVEVGAGAGAGSARADSCPGRRSCRCRPAHRNLLAVRFYRLLGSRAGLPSLRHSHPHNR